MENNLCAGRPISNEKRACGNLGLPTAGNPEFVKNPTFKDLSSWWLYPQSRLDA
jgi:hypothetical protein